MLQIRDEPSMNSSWDLYLRRERHESVMVLTLGGRLAVDASSRLREELVDAIRDGQRRIVVDLAEVDCMSSAGARAVDAAILSMHHAGGHIMLCGLQEPVRWYSR